MDPARNALGTGGADGDGSACRRHLVVLVLLSLLIASIYGHTLRYAWHFDDYPNILVNPKIHMTELTLASVIDSFRAKPSGVEENSHKIHRPVACFTFAVNWYWGADNVIGYHLVNLLIHLLSAFFLYRTIDGLFQHPRLAPYRCRAFFVSVLAAVLWAVNPVQVQAITYIVQRMASLAALFSIMALWLYVSARMQPPSIERYVRFVGCAAAFVCAVGSKENTVFLPIAFFLIEMIFIQKELSPTARRVLKRSALFTAGCTLLAAIAVLFFMRDDLATILSHYSRRAFTPIERMMTQPRVLMLYLSQIFYPLPSRLSISHDFAVSTDVWTPWTTLPAILVVLGLIVWAICQARRYPLVSFAILFFFAGHAVESSFIPIEMVFEHRNYLPAMFLFLPVSNGIWRLMAFYEGQKRSMYILLAAAIPCLIVVLGLATYVRNMAWADPGTLWRDAMEKAPGLYRPYINLGAAYYERELSDDEGAHRVFLEGLEASDRIRPLDRVRLLMNAHALPFRKKAYHQALGYLDQAYACLMQEKRYSESRQYQDYYRNVLYRQTVVLMKLGRWLDAGVNIDRLLSDKRSLPVTEQVDHHLLAGLIRLRLDGPEQAIGQFRKAYQLNQKDWNPLLNLGVCQTLMGRYEKADASLKKALEIRPSQFLIYIALIQNHSLAGNAEASEAYLTKLLSHFPPANISDKLQQLDTNPLFLPFDKATIVSTVQEAMLRAVRDFDTVH